MMCTLAVRRYALTGKEVKMILMQRLVKVDGKVRTDTTYPAGFMDVIELEKTNEHFRYEQTLIGMCSCSRCQQLRRSVS